MNTTKYLIVGLFLAIFSVTSADKLRSFGKCSSRSPGHGDGTITEIRVIPCAEAASRRPCVLRKGSNVTIEVDFTANKAGDNIIGQAYWAKRLLDIPLPGMNDNSCSTLTCPIVPGSQQRYRYQLHILRQFPSHRYDVKWKLTGDGFQLCFIFPIQIIG